MSQSINSISLDDKGAFENDTSSSNDDKPIGQMITSYLGMMLPLKGKNECLTVEASKKDNPSLKKEMTN